MDPSPPANDIQMYNVTSTHYKIVSPTPPPLSLLLVYYSEPDQSLQSVTGVSTTSTSKSLTWLHPDPFYCNGIITQYRTRYTINTLQNPSTWPSVTLNFNSTGTIISSLQMFTLLYTFTVSAGTAQGFGIDSQPILVRTFNDSNNYTILICIDVYIFLSASSIPQFLKKNRSS